MKEVTMNVYHQAARSLLRGVLGILQGVAAIVLVCMAVTVLSCLAQGSL
jgi:EamA domain-containing membrane protein RarD